MAHAAGVSLKTVSRVVNAEPGVRPDTAARVEATIERLGFRRNDLARALRRGQQSRLIGLVTENVANPFYSAITRGAEEVARDRGLMLIAGSSDEDAGQERELALLFCERRVQGLLLVPAGDDHRYLERELRLGLEVVFVDRPPTDVEADAVLLDNLGGARSAVEHLLRLGHERIAMVGGENRVYTTRERWQGFSAGLAAAGRRVDERLVRLGARDPGAAERATRELLALPDPPTAVFAANNRAAIGVLRALAATGEHLDLVCFDDLELAEQLWMPVSAISYDPAELGRTAARLLFERLDGDASPPRRIVIPTTLVARRRTLEAA